MNLIRSLVRNRGHLGLVAAVGAGRPLSAGTRLALASLLLDLNQHSTEHEDPATAAAPCAWCPVIEDYRRAVDEYERTGLGRRVPRPQRP